MTDRLEVSIIDILRRKYKVLFDDILQQIFLSFTNALTPERKDIRKILEEYAERCEANQWRLKPQINSHISLHDFLISYLAELGKILGFNIWIGKKEQAKIVRGNKLSNHVDSRFHNEGLKIIINKHNFLNQIENIDVVWIKNKKSNMLLKSNIQQQLLNL